MIDVPINRTFPMREDYEPEDKGADAQNEFSSRESN
jgi:hypothetical protein